MRVQTDPSGRTCSRDTTWLLFVRMSPTYTMIAGCVKCPGRSLSAVDKVVQTSATKLDTGP